MKSKCILVLCIFFTLVSVQANILTFVDDKANFFSVTGATSVTGPYPNLGVVPNFTQLGGAVFSLGPGASNLHFSTGGGSDWTSAIAGNTFAVSGPESFNLDLDDPTFAIGFDMVESTSNASSTFQITLKNGGSVVDSFTYNTPTSVTVLFVGVASDQAFNRVEVLETVGNSQDEYFGQFFTSTNSSSVPEPSSLLLLAFAGIGCFFSKKK